MFRMDLWNCGRCCEICASLKSNKCFDFIALKLPVVELLKGRRHWTNDIFFHASLWWKKISIKVFPHRSSRLFNVSYMLHLFSLVVINYAASLLDSMLALNLISKIDTFSWNGIFFFSAVDLERSEKCFPAQSRSQTWNFLPVSYLANIKVQLNEKCKFQRTNWAFFLTSESGISFHSLHDIKKIDVK